VARGEIARRKITSIDCNGIVKEGCIPEDWMQMQENFRVKGKKLYFGFMDLEKPFDRVPREVISWAMHKLGVEEWLVSAVMSMFWQIKTV